VFLSEVDAGREVRRMSRKREKRKEGVDRDASQVMEVFGKGGRDWSDFLCNLFISKYHSGGRGRGEREEKQRRAGRGRDTRGICMAWDRAVEDSEDLQAMAATFAQARRKIDPAATVSQVKDGYLNIS